MDLDAISIQMERLGNICGRKDILSIVLLINSRRDLKDRKVKLKNQLEHESSLYYR